MRVQSDLAFSFSEPATGGLAGRQFSGTVEADGQHIEVSVDTLPELSVRAAAPALRKAANTLDRLGLTLSVKGPDGPVLTIGAVRGRLLERLFTGTRHVRLHDVRRLTRLVRKRPGRTSRLQLADLLPPSTVFPIAPTFRPRPRRITTTHDPLVGGSPRFFFAASGRWDDGTRVFYLKPGTTIGSAPECDLQLAGIDPVQAEVRRDDEDEYLLVPVGTSPTVVNGRPVTGEQLMRTGTRIQLGRWTVSYFRAEEADHGRPYGGRLGGELGYQRPQRKPRYRSPGPHA